MNLINIKEHTFIDKGFSENKAVIVDLGACLGEFTKEFSERFNGIKKSVLIEANPTNFNRIQEMENVSRLNRFISTTPNGFEIFREDPSSPYNGTSMFTYFENPIEHQIERISIDRIIEMYGMEKIDSLKIDIEGAEYPVILDSPLEVLNKFRILVIEFHDLDALLHHKGFELIDLTFSKLLKNLINLGLSKDVYLYVYYIVYTYIFNL